MSTISATTAVGTSLETIAEVSSSISEFLGFQIVNGATALNAFQVQARMGASAPWVTIQSGNFTDATGFSPTWATAELATLGDSASAILYVLGKHAYDIRLRASVAAGTSSVTVYSNAGA